LDQMRQNSGVAAAAAADHVPAMRPSMPRTR
jgi:hypothetical protein